MGPGGLLVRPARVLVSRPDGYPIIISQETDDPPICLG